MDPILRRLVFFCWTFLAALLGLTPAEVKGSTNDAGIQIRSSPEGRFVYERNCVACHGVRGDGRGEIGLTVKPPPCDFAIGVFKYRSTPAGFLPTDADLARTFREGVSDTTMPAFSNLSEREVRAVVQYLKTLSKRWRNPDRFVSTLPPAETF